MSFSFASKKAGNWSDPTVWHSAYNITAVNQGTKTFSFATDQHLEILAGTSIVVAGSTGNDGTYTVASCAFSTTTNVVVNESIPDATADGHLTSQTLPQSSGYSTATSVNHALLVDVVVGTITRISLSASGSAGAFTFPDATTDYLAGAAELDCFGTCSITGTTIHHTFVLKDSGSAGGLTYTLTNVTLGTGVSIAGQFVAGLNTFLMNGCTINTAGNVTLDATSLIGGTNGLTILGMGTLADAGNGFTLGGNITLKSTLNVTATAPYTLGTTGKTIIVKALQDITTGTTVTLAGTFILDAGFGNADVPTALESQTPTFVIRNPAAILNIGADPAYTVSYAGPVSGVQVMGLGL